MARDFNSTNYILAGTATDINFGGTDISISCWVKPDTSTGFRSLVSKYSSPTLQYLLRVDSGTPAMWVGNTTDYVGVSGGGSLSVGAWGHVCGTKGAANMQVYVNNVKGSDQANTRAMNAGNGINTYLGESAQAGESGDQKMAEIAIWSAQLNADEVRALSRGFCPLLIRPESLRFYLPCLQKTLHDKDLVAGIAVTGNGSYVEEPHPPILYPRSGS